MIVLDSHHRRNLSSKSVKYNIFSIANWKQNTDGSIAESNPAKTLEIWHTQVYGLYIALYPWVQLYFNQTFVVSLLWWFTKISVDSYKLAEWFQEAKW